MASKNIAQIDAETAAQPAGPPRRLRHPAPLPRQGPRDHRRARMASITSPARSTSGSSNPSASKADAISGSSSPPARATARSCEWINKNAKSKHSAWEIVQWSSYQEQRGPTDLGTVEFFNGMHKAAGKSRDDIATWFDVLDVDDHVTFGGKA